MKLTDSQSRALRLAAREPLRFYRGGWISTPTEAHREVQGRERTAFPGQSVSAGTIDACIARGLLVDANEPRAIRDAPSVGIYARRWTLTDAGRAALPVSAERCGPCRGSGCTVDEMGQALIGTTCGHCGGSGFAPLEAANGGGDWLDPRSGPSDPGVEVKYALATQEARDRESDERAWVSFAAAAHEGLRGVGDYDDLDHDDRAGARGQAADDDLAQLRERRDSGAFGRRK